MHSNNVATRNLPTAAPPSAEPSEPDFDPAAAAIEALEKVRFDLTQRMNVARTPEESERLSKTWKHVIAAIYELEKKEAA